MNKDQMRQKLIAYAMALPDDIGVTDGDIVAQGVRDQRWRGSSAGRINPVSLPAF